MFPKRLQRRLMVTTMAAILMLAGVLPAAAVEGPAWKGALDWLARAWAEVTALLPGVEASVDCDPEIDPGGCPRLPEADAGLEIDPDG